jgi:surfactin synthase thioesterase subunit
MLRNRYCPSELASDDTIRLVCLPHAGGGTAVFHRWRRTLPKGIGLLPICLPGRESRIAEPPITRMRVLVPEIVDAIEPALDRPYVLLGHSMGAWIAFELARELRRRGRTAPRLLVAAGSPPPHEPRSRVPLHKLPDAEFVAVVGREFDGIPPAVRENEELLALVLPVMRADFELTETYEYVEEPPLGCDILALGGSEDPTVTASELNEWGRYTTGGFEARHVAGGHFFLFRDAESGDRATSPAAVQLILQQLERYRKPSAKRSVGED